MFSSIASIQEAISQGKSAVEITKFFLDKIEHNSHLNAFLEVFESSAIKKAEEVDAKIKAGKAGKLAGVVIGLKDNICYKNHKVSASSKILEGFESLYSSTVVERLLAEDAIIIGRLNCDEFAMGSSNENSAFGPVKNPLNNKTVPGGSSGGSAAALAAGLCTVTLGSDTGGSIRQPASFCGLVGFKPTYGVVSRHGLIAYASSFDQIGPFTNSAEDAATILEIIGGSDEFDSTASPDKLPIYQDVQIKKNYKIALLQEVADTKGVDDEVLKGLQNFTDNLKSAGHEIEYVSFPYLDYIVPTYYVLTTAEASSNLARFDGVHYGYRSQDAVGVEEIYKKSRTDGFGPEVKRRIMSGTFVLSNEFYDAYYSQGQKVRRVLKNRIEEIFKDFDFILTPTTPNTAFDIDSVKDPIQMYLQDIFTVTANLTGHPAVSLPLGQHSNGLPFGMQLMGKSFSDMELLKFSQQIQNTNSNK